MVSKSPAPSEHSGGTVTEKHISQSPQIPQEPPKKKGFFSRKGKDVADADEKEEVKKEETVQVAKTKEPTPVSFSSLFR